MFLPEVVHCFGHAMQQQYGEKVHKLAINLAFSCPSRDGQKGIGGCAFCNNASFNSNAKNPPSVQTQINRGKQKWKVLNALYDRLSSTNTKQGFSL